MEKMEKGNKKENASTVAAPVVDEKALKEKKAASAKAWKERKDKEAAERSETAKKLIKFLEDKKVELNDEYKDLLNFIANPAAKRGSSTGLLYTVFGDSPKVGDKITVIDMITKTLKGKAEFDRFVKQQAEKGVIIEFTENKEDKLKSTYTIKKL